MRGDQCLDGRMRAISHTKVRMKSAEMNRNIDSKMLDDPIAHALQFISIIIQLRNDKVGDLEPNLRFLFQVDESVQHWIEMRVGDFGVELFTETLEIDISGIHRCKKDSSSFWMNVPGGHRDVLDT